MALKGILLPMPGFAQPSLLKEHGGDEIFPVLLLRRCNSFPLYRPIHCGQTENGAVNGTTGM
jgi:hypothetical protein